MTRTSKDRMTVLPCANEVPKLKELETRFIAFWTRMRRNVHGNGRKGKLDFLEERTAKRLAEGAHVRRLREAGFSSVTEKELPAVMALAAEGGHLSGPSSEEGVHRLVAALHAESPWMREVSTWIMAQMLQHVESGGRGIALPPVILAGPPGIGKSHYARTLAKLAEVPVRMIDVGGGSAGFRISGTEKGWGTAQPGIPVETILATKVANPLLVVDEVDKGGTTYSTKGTSSSLTTSLLQILESGTARHFECPYFRLQFDLSRVIWIMTANEVDQIPAPLRDRSRVFVLPKLSPGDAVAHFERLTGGCDGGDYNDRCRGFIATMSERPGGISLRQIQQLADAVGAPISQLLH